MAKPSITSGFQTCVGQQWTKEVYSDFTIVVEDQEFKCHRFILGACSTFINGLLRSEMIESLEHKVGLQNMSKETFKVILNYIYKGEDGLTVDNVIHVWHATHFLDIAYLLNACENFIIENLTLSNYEEFYHHSKLLNSENVKNVIKQFMTNNFDNVWRSTTFLHMSFRDVHMMIDNHYLKVKCEDTVVDAILEWVAHQDNKDIAFVYNVECSDNEMITLKDQLSDIPERSQILNKESGSSYNNRSVVSAVAESSLTTVYNSQSVLSTVAESTLNKDQELIDLLKASRLCLASRKCLEKLMENPKIRSNLEALKSVYESLLYHWKAKSYSNHFIVRFREFSGLSNVMAFVSAGEIKVYSLQRECLYTVYNSNAPNPDLSNTHGIAAINSKLYFDTRESIGSYAYSFQSFDPESDDWENVAEIKVPFAGILFSKHDTLTYINAGDKYDRIVLTRDYPFLLIHDHSGVRFATILNDNILIFCTSNNINSVYRHNSMTKDVTTLPNITGTYTDMCSFQKDQNHYILQKDGILWLVEEYSSDNFIFTRLAQLWNEELPLKGAVFYGDQLFVFYSETSSNNSPVESLFRSSVGKTIPNIGSITIRFIGVNSQTPVIPMTISTECLRNEPVS